SGEALLTGGFDLSNADALMEFYIANQKRLSMASKIMFPIPNRRLAKRLYRLSMPTLIVWGKQDRLIPPVYADHFKSLIANAEISLIDAAGHMAPYEQTEAFTSAVTSFL